MAELKWTVEPEEKIYKVAIEKIVEHIEFTVFLANHDLDIEQAAEDFVDVYHGELDDPYDTFYTQLIGPQGIQATVAVAVGPFAIVAGYGVVNVNDMRLPDGQNTIGKGELGDG